MLHEPIQELSILNKKPALLNGPELLHLLVPNTAATSTDTAIDFLKNGSRQNISYGALHSLSDRLAQRITIALSRLENVSDVVPVFLPQSPELYIALLAILKAGKAFCPIGLDTPHERLRFILNDVSADLVITDSSFASKFQQHTNVHVVLVEEEPALCSYPQSVELSQPQANNLAYVLYTSGSTGLPKAVSVSHRAVTQSLLAHQRHIPTFSRFLQFAAPTFDVSIFEIFFPLLRGCTLVGCTRELLVEDLTEVIKTMEVDAAEFTPTVVAGLLRGRQSVPSLKLLLTIGEMLTKHVIDEFGGSSEQESILWGMYGPTEAAIHCTIQPAFQKDSPVGNIGYPLDTVSAFIVAPASESKLSTDIAILPVGEIGELIIGGSQVADEYLNRPELNSAAFIRHPEFGYLYRTGDKARIAQDGTLECFGRIKSGQVKLRGQRVELGEIEQVISKVEGCLAVSTVIINDDLIAFCAVGEANIEKEVISSLCREWLPKYMIPTDIIFVQRMPQLSSGKIDKEALEAQYLKQRKDEYKLQRRPLDPSSSSILRVLESVLERHIVPETLLQYAGLDSLRSIRVSSLLREQGYDIGAVDVLSASTLHELVRKCGAKLYDRTAHRRGFNGFKNPILLLPELLSRQRSVADIIPCTPLQEAMLAETVIRPEAYCNWVEVELDRPYTVSDIRTSIERLAQEYEILRSGFCITSMSSSSSSFAQIIWKELDSSQITEVTAFSRSYSLASSNSLLRPLGIQIHANLRRPRILFQLHHALYDGWSFELLLTDFKSILDGKVLTARPQYSDVVEYYTLRNSETSKDASRKYWTMRLKDAQPFRLPNFNGRVMPETRLCRMSRTSAIQVQSLFDYAAKLAINPQVLYQAALAYILGGYRGTTDVIFGTVTSGRTIPVTSVEKIIGPCIATLPLRVDLSGLSSIRDLITSIQDENRSMLPHCTLPLRDITKLCSQHPGTRLFDVLFVWQQSLNTSDAHDLLPRVLDSADELEFKITLEYEPRGAEIYSKATYDPTIVPLSQIEHLIGQIDEVVQHILSNPGDDIRDLSKCFSLSNLSISNPVPDQEEILEGLAQTVERWASEQPSREAIIFGSSLSGEMSMSETMTYAALNDRANQLAHAILASNLPDDELICVLMEKSLDLYVSILAVLKAGHGYLPIVPDSPHERTRKILDDAQVTLCISNSSSSSWLRTATSCTILNVDKLEFSTFSNQNPVVKYRGTHLAYAVFTSGSTGSPKGVLVTQDNLMSNIKTLHGIYPTGEESRMLQSCSQAFDVSAFEIFFTWYAGMCLCAATKDELYENLESSISRLGITHLSMTPTVASLVNPENVPKVQFLVTAGEALTEHVRRQWMGRGLYQGYGPSETTNICTVKCGVSAEDLINNIGQPFRNTSAFIFEPDIDRITPQGFVGELCFGGAQVFRGYLNMPELNSQKIMDHPEYGRIYRSGDMGMLLPDGSILFTGRSDDQVKIRGQRVELGEITSVVLDCDAVEDCATLVYHEHSKGHRIIAFWVPSGKTQESFKPLPSDQFTRTTFQIFEALVSRLPSYMVPTHLIPISQIPVTTQTKIDKRLLLANYKDLTHSYLESVAYDTSSSKDDNTLTEAEAKIAQVVSEVLQVSRSDISRHSPLFGLGLDSISAIHLSNRLRNNGYGKIPISTILKHPTISQLCSIHAMDSSMPEPSKPRQQLAEIFPSSLFTQIKSEFAERNTRIKNILPCTPLQAAMLSSRDSVGGDSYCNTTVFKINVDVGKIKECWSTMFERHDILRTAFVPTDDPHYAFAQVVVEYVSTPFDDITPDQQIEDYLKGRIPDLLSSHQPPVCLAIRETRETSQLVVCCHHSLYDGTAFSGLLHEVEDLYKGKELAPTIQYERYLQYIVDLDLGAVDAFWKQSLSGLEPSFFPQLGSGVMGSTAAISPATRTLKVSLSDARRYCRSISSSLLPTLQAAWAKMLYFYTGEEDLCFGNVVSGRSLPEADLDRLIAPCFNTIPVRVNFDFGNSNTDLVKTLHTVNVDSSPFQLTPLRRIHALLGNEGSRLFDTVFILQQPTEPLDVAIWTLEQDLGTMDVPIVCEISQNELADTLTMTLHRQISLISEKDIDRVAESFDCALKGIVQFSHATARDSIGFPDNLLAESNLQFKSIDAPREQCLHSAFEHNAEHFPDRIALDYLHTDGSRTTWCFKELNEAANRIANALVSSGINLDDVVPIYIPKSPQFYASVLGVLKAGAAFTPVHPGLPTARKQFMILELKPKIILCIEDGCREWCGDIPILNVNTTGSSSIQNPAIQGLASTNLAYNLYTSGSTGVPKAVSMDHRSPMHTIEASKQLVPWNKDSRLLQYAAISFDMCYYDCFLAWSFGFTLCATDQDSMLNDLTKAIVSLNADLLDLTPSVAATISKSQVPSVKWLYCIGEPMSASVIKEWEGACVNSYGPTEAAFCTTIFPVDASIKAGVIGKPFPTTSFAVFPKNGDRALPVFGVGELLIGGAQLARGYRNKDSLTAEKFVQRNGQRFYKSGDLVRMLNDGNFEFIGRVDDQVKIRGLRVELGEINHIIQHCDDRVVAATTHILRKEGSAKDQLTSFLTTNCLGSSEQRTLTDKVREAASQTLPTYMVPRFIIIVDQIPRSAAGKVDKRALLDIFRQSGHTDDVPDSAESHQWTETEALIRQQLSRLSRTPTAEIRPRTSIYQLGLDSISAVQIANGLRRVNLSVTATDVLRHPCCVDLAACIEVTMRRLPEPDNEFDFASFDKRHRPLILQQYAVENRQIQAVLPCTPLQQGIVSQFLAKEGAVYLNHFQLQLDGSVRKEDMKEAWRLAMDKFAMLRTGFIYTNDVKQPLAMIQYKPETVRLPWEEYTVGQNRPGPCSVQDWVQQIGHRGCENLREPLWHVRLVQDGAQHSLDVAIFHALFDATSLQMILDNVSTTYRTEASRDNQPNPQPLEPAIATILHQSNTDDESRTGFWKSLGRDMIPTKFPNLSPLQENITPSASATRMSSMALNELESGCQAANISLQAAGIATWALILSAYTGEIAVTLGVVLSGRNTDETVEVPFPCITTVPFVVKVDSDVKRLLESVISMNADVLEHQFTPLQDIQKLMGCPNEAPFDSLFAYQKIASSQIQDHPWTIRDDQASTEYPISLELEPLQGRMQYRLTYLPHIVPTPQAHLILEQVDYLFQDIISPSPRAKTADIFHTLFSVTLPKQPTLPSPATLLHELVELTAQKYPDRVALEFASSIQGLQYTSTRWTYAELDGEGNRVANLLQSKGVQQGSLVGVCFDKCPEAYFAMLGILKVGCAFVALDPGAPVARKSFIVQDSGVQIILSMVVQSSDLMDATQAQILNLDELDRQGLAATKPNLDRQIDPQDLSYCLYTSGTTGTPKGCELTHDNAVQALLAFERLFSGHWDQNSRWLQFASFHFDVSVLEQYWSWFMGITLVSVPRDVLFEDLAAAIKCLEITHIDLTPSLARLLHPDEVPSLCKGVFITGGESLRQEILDVWGPKGVIYNGYGPTEATIGVTMYPRVPANGKPSNIGPQFDNVGSYVLQPGTVTPVLRGGVGELCVSGKLVGKGYLNRPDLTKDRFPYLVDFDVRVYRTGDLVRILHDGSFDFIGRADDQIKLRGQRLEIGEINSVIRKSSDGIVDVTTLVLKHPRQEKEQLVSFVVTASNSSNNVQIVPDPEGQLIKARNSCLRMLPGYMVPTYFIALSRMPLSANNKIEARVLRDMYEESDPQQFRLESSTSDKDDWSAEEMGVKNVLVQLLSTSPAEIQRSSNIFELGLDSVSVIPFTQALKRSGFSKATASLIMKNATITALANALSQQSPSEDRGSILVAQQSIMAIQHRHRRTVALKLGIDMIDIESIAPCTALQQGMIARSLESDGLYYNEFRFRLDRNVHNQKLYAAWTDAFVSTTILRTVFCDTDDGYVQAVLQGREVPWMYHIHSEEQSMDNLLGDLREKWWKDNKSVIARPFQIHYVACGSQVVLAVHIFHGLYDGVGIELLFDRIWDSYNDKANHDTGSHFHEVLPYGPLRSLAGARNFWQSQLTNERFLPIPSLAGNENQLPVTVTRHISIDGQAYENTRRKLNVTHQAIAQTCWASVLRKTTQRPVTIGVVVSGRQIDFEGTDRVIGPLFNTIPYEYRVRKGDSWASKIQRTHVFNIAAHPYQHTPLRDIMKWKKRLPDQPLFDNLFVYQMGSDGGSTKNELWELQDVDMEADYPIALEVEQMSDGSLRVILAAQGHILDTESATKLLSEFEAAIHQVMNNPDAVVPNMQDEQDYDQQMEDEPRNSEVKLNGLPANFEWTPVAVAIREEIQQLANANDNIGPYTSIFELGLDSIDAIKLSSRLKKRSINLPVSAIMHGRTIPNMLGKLQGSNGVESSKPPDMTFEMNKTKLDSFVARTLPELHGIESVLPLTPLQEGMVAEMVGSEYEQYFNHDILQLAPGTNSQELRQAWAKVVENSPILRTSFVEVDDPEIEISYAQIIHQSPHNFLLHEQREGKPDFEEITRHIAEKASAFSDVPPFYVCFVETPDHCYLVLSIAHALYDGWSLGLLHADVHSAYNNDYSTRESYEPALCGILTTAGSDAAAFWEDYLSNSTPTILASMEQYSGKHCLLERDSTLALSGIQQFTKRNNITLQALGQTAFAALLAYYARSLDVMFGSVLSGRDDDSSLQLLFPTMNTVAVRTILHGSCSEMLQYVQENLAQIKQHQHFPLRQAHKLSGAMRGKLFDSLFIYQKTPETGDAKGELYTSVEAHSQVEYPLCVEMEIVDGRLVWRCSVNQDWLDEAEGRLFLERLDQVLRHIIEKPGAPIIAFTSGGVSVCGLATFKTDGDNTANGQAVDPNVTRRPKQPDPSTMATIREVLASVSKMPLGDVKDDMTIFHIGLDSISAIKVSTLLRKRSISLSVGDLLRAKSVEHMALIADEDNRAYKGSLDTTRVITQSLAHIDVDRVVGGAVPLSREQARPGEPFRKATLPATSGQVYLLSMWLNSNGAAFYPEFRYTLKGKMTLEEIQRSWEKLCLANPILRTRFFATNHLQIPFIQVILDGPITSKVIDITDREHPGSDSENALSAPAQSYVDLFVSSTSDGWDICLKIHHALYDGVSLPMLMQQFQSICNQQRSQSVNNFDSFLASGLDDIANTQMSFWTKYLANVEPRHFTQPSHAPDQKAEVFKPGLLSSVEPLDALARKHGVTIHSLFLAIYAKVYTARTGTPSTSVVVIGIYLANRSHPTIDLSQSAFPTVNFVPLRVSRPLENSLLEVAKQIQRDLQEISTPTVSSVGLMEIYRWTGVQIDTFVNFLRLPESSSDDSVPSMDITISPVEQWGDPISRVRKVLPENFEAPKELRENRAQSSYLHTVDIEATIRNGGLDVGIFAPEEMISLDGAEKMMDDLREELAGLCEL